MKDKNTKNYKIFSEGNLVIQRAMVEMDRTDTQFI